MADFRSAIEHVEADLAKIKSEIQRLERLRDDLVWAERRCETDSLPESESRRNGAARPDSNGAKAIRGRRRRVRYRKVEIDNPKPWAVLVDEVLAAAEAPLTVGEIVRAVQDHGGREFGPRSRPDVVIRSTLRAKAEERCWLLEEDDGPQRWSKA